MATALCAAIPEIIGLVFSFSTIGTCTNCIRVCRAWQEIAKDYIWENVDILPLLALLAPLQKANASYNVAVE